MKINAQAVLDELLKITAVAQSLEAELPFAISKAITTIAAALKFDNADEPKLVAELFIALADAKRKAAPELAVAIQAAENAIREIESAAGADIVGRVNDLEVELTSDLQNWLHEA